MSATFPSHDDLRIPPKPRSVRLSARPRLPALPVQLLLSAVSGFVLAWGLTHLIIG